MQFQYNNNLYPIKIIRKDNKNTYIRVKDREIIVTTNYFMTISKIEKLIKENELSLIKMIEKDCKRRKESKIFYLWGKEYDVVYGELFNQTSIVDNKIYVTEQVRLDKYLAKEIEKIFTYRLNYWYNMFEERIPKPNLKIRKMTSRWGVCNLKNNNVTLNYNLYKYDIKYLDYVIIHELAHFMYPNHGTKFWLLVGKYCKDYKKRRKELKS